MAAKLRTQAAALLLIQMKERVFRAKAEFCALLVPVDNPDRFTEPEWENLQEIWIRVREAQAKLDEALALIEAIKP
jgi:hypothetical protein